MKEARLLQEGKIGVMPTDTIYGLVARAENERAVERVYALKGRRPDKPCIILVADISDLARFGAALTPAQEAELQAVWPGPVSVIVPVNAGECLHRGTHSLAFRLPGDERLRAFLAESGPLIAPSANPEGLPPASSIAEARDYFGDQVDFYMDGGTRRGKPSTLITLSADGSHTVLRD